MVVVNGNRIRKLREEREMSQAELAETAGASQAMIAHVEAGKKQPGVAVLKLIADSFGVQMEELLMGEGQTL